MELATVGSAIPVTLASMLTMAEPRTVATTIQRARPDESCRDGPGGEAVRGLRADSW